MTNWKVKLMNFYLVCTICMIGMNIGNAAGKTLYEPQLMPSVHKTLKEDVILNDIKQHGKARVLINLNIFTNDPNSMLPTSMDYYKKISTQQQRLLDDLKDLELDVMWIYENVPAINAKINKKCLEKLKTNPIIDCIEPDEPVYLMTRQGIPLIEADYYSSQYSGSGISIAIVDDGIDYTHPQLGNGGFPNSKVIGGYDFGDSDGNPIPRNTEGHGTACAGIAAGTAYSYGDYIGGVACTSKLYALKVEDSDGDIYDGYITAAWDWCVSHQYDDPVNPIMVISCSLGGGLFSDYCDTSKVNLKRSALAANAAGITIVAASGNDGYSSRLSSPACLSNVISVGATYDANIGSAVFQYCTNTATYPKKIACYSNSASILNILAPSHNAYTLDNGGSNGYSDDNFNVEFGGTSAACPYVAGAIANMQQAAKSTLGNYLNPSEIRDILSKTGDLITDNRNGIKFPFINVKSAIDQIVFGPVTVEGRVTDNSGNGIDGVAIAFSNSKKTIVTSNGGSYSVDMIYGYSGTAIPLKEGYVFNPSSRTYVNITSDQIDQNYTAIEVAEVIIGTGTSTWDYPFSAYYHDARTQTIYLASEIGGAKNFTSLALDVTTLPGQVLNNFTIRMKHTDLTTYGASPIWESVGWTTVYQANQTISNTGWNTFTFTTPFAYNGTQNLLVDISFNNTSYTTSGYCRYSSVTGSRSICYRTDSSYGDPLNWNGASSPTPSTTNKIPNIKLTFESLPQTVKIWGYVFAPYSGGRMQGVTMQGLPGSPVTDPWGYYEAYVPIGWSATVRPILEGYIFKTTNDQDELSYSNVRNDITWQNYNSYVHADLTRNGEVNIEDYSFMAATWMQSNCSLSNQWCSYSDINHNGQVELNDFLEFVDHWLEGVSLPVVFHQGKVDPLSEGWSWEGSLESTNTGPMDKGAWFVQNNTVDTPPDWGLFRKELTHQQITAALDSTWTLSVRIAVTEPTTNNSGGVWAGFSTGTTRYGLNFTRDEHGVQRVECPIPGGALVSHVFLDYQLIQLIGQGPVASLYIDGILKQTNYSGYNEPDVIAILWGDWSSHTLGRGNFNRVSFSIGSEEIALHEGSTNPATEGWTWYTMTGSTTTHGPSEIMAYDAWCVSDTSSAIGGWGRYRFPISDEQAALANTNGWVLSLRAKVAVEMPPEVAIWAEFRDSSTRYTIGFQKDSAGIQTVRCGLGDDGTGYKYTDSFVVTDYQLVELKGKNNTASLYIDGVPQLSGYIGDHEVHPKQIDWGSCTSSLDTGICYWNLVEFKINP